MSDAIERRDVLDLGFVELIDFMGGDNAVVDAARVSFGKRAEQYTDDQNERLLRYLAEHDHGTPREMVTFKFRVKAPVLVWWHWVRHRMASYNFISGRYVPFDEREVHRPDTWRIQSKSNKQGSDGEVDPDLGFLASMKLDRVYALCFETYDWMLDKGFAKEQARLCLPGWALYYEAIFQVNARSLDNFLRLREGEDAQAEIRQYASAIRDIVHTTHPKLYP
jgi:thymidylate synthase (FAD)